MNRKDFLMKCGFACLGTTMASAILSSCASSRSISGEIIDTDLVVPLSSFAPRKSEVGSHRRYIVVQHEELLYPIYVFRFSEQEYSAVLMQCTHQGAELQVFGDVLQCPAHGSEFDNKGHVQNGPANTNLRSFPLEISNNQLKISLKHA